MSPAASSASSRRTTEELSSDKEAASSFCRIAAGAAGEMQKRQPGRFRQSERAHPVIDDAAPKPRGLGNLRAEPGVDPAARSAREGD